ncbi:NADPH:quinone oxidoreductase [Bradyrhizobium macuxiense]|uniref:NADPH:quinone oxidoreductase n=1 Tax=Bradyrhizobium macuxiense TaxID=1755647 RepID=A0A109JVT3_9BRAD|nr:NADPH:quinone reductase [Bradyrhizobium macuxiense]KWV56008.1 NADPH:quinone oxidoreductase [Bradyrhizobium macuxiense]
MRAAFYTRQGPAHDVLQIGEHPTPAPGPGEVRVKLRTSGVNPSDWKVRRGGFGRGLAAPLVIPHSDGAGDIDAVGPGVADRVGERVWVWNGQWKRPHGTAAEYIVLPSAQAVPLPANVGYAEGACLGIPALTAVQAVRLANIDRHSTVLVAGGAGSVAHYAIQLAKLRGATVITTVSGDAKAEHAGRGGADHVVNYRTGDVGARVRDITQGRGVDTIIELDLTSNAKLYPLLLRPHGTVVVYGMSANESVLPSLWLMQNSITLRLFLIYDISDADRLAGIAELTKILSEGRLVHAIARRLPLEAIAEAHDMIERGDVVGNVILNISEETHGG